MFGLPLRNGMEKKWGKREAGVQEKNLICNWQIKEVIIMV
jgi:hypothetical protein